MRLSHVSCACPAPISKLSTLKQEDYVEDILDSGKHLLSLINDILDFAKVNSGKMELVLSIVSVFILPLPIGEVRIT